LVIAVGEKEKGRKMRKKQGGIRVYCIAVPE